MATTVAKPRGMSRSTAEIMDSVERDATWKRNDEARLMPGPKIATKKKYLFRFLPGTGPASLNLKVDSIPDDFPNERQEAFHKRSYARRVTRVHGEDAKYDLGSIRDKLGGSWISFTSMPGNKNVAATCYYATDDPEIAAFIRHKARVGKSFWRHLREERPTQMIEVNGISVPNTSEGWSVAQKAAQRAALELDEE